jgi:hypothetical protein
MAQDQAAVCLAMKDGAPFGIGGIWENWSSVGRADSELGGDHDRRQRVGGRNPRPSLILAPINIMPTVWLLRTDAPTESSLPDSARFF